MIELLREFPNSRLYAILDMARRGGIRRFAREHWTSPRCLLAGRISERVARVTPHLVQLRPEDGTLRQLIHHGWGRSWSVVLSSTLETEALLDHLARQLIIKEGGERSFFRFYDPRVLRRKLHGANPGRLRALFGGVHHLAVESEDARSLCLYSVRGRRLHRWDQRCEVSAVHTTGRGDGLPRLAELEEELASALDALAEEEQSHRALLAALEEDRARLQGRLERKEEEAAAAADRLARQQQQLRAVEAQHVAAAEQLKRHRAGGQGAPDKPGGQQSAFSTLDGYYRAKAEVDRLQRRRKRAAARRAGGEIVQQIDRRLTEARAALVEQQRAVEEQKRRDEELSAEGGQLQREVDRRAAERAALQTDAQGLHRCLIYTRGEAETLRLWLARAAARTPAELPGQRPRLVQTVERARAELAHLGDHMEEVRLRYNREVQEHNRQQRLTLNDPGRKGQTLEGLQALGSQLEELREVYRAGLLRQSDRTEGLMERLASQAEAVRAQQATAAAHVDELARLLDPPARVEEEGPQPFEEAATIHESAPPRHDPDAATPGPPARRRGRAP